jgi:hypothetical protein
MQQHLANWCSRLQSACREYIGGFRLDTMLTTDCEPEWVIHEAY